ncbi:ABC transporter ATP-binding protein [Lachnospiraceae bacterium TWA4]|nr:ABC transporter ATP-binding protein [Lachnospiraceae bacterium TWA4]
MLETKEISKRYGSNNAIDNLSMNLKEGHIYGMLGPNGSGKSTWMKTVATFIVPDKGQILLNGIPVGVETKKHIAYMSTEPFYYNYMKIQDVGKYYEDFFEDFNMKRFEALVEKMNLDMKMKVRSLSSGMAAKLKIAATLSRRAKVYLLDEPFNGIDLLARDEIVKMILESASPDNIMVISSHMVEELEEIADSVLFIREGHLVLGGKVKELIETKGKSVADLYREIYSESEMQ